ncbi:hypothetical protein J2747_001855 [Thermococcus stetteri]|nr:hypothetical protein [Thermococcus stetteri]
MDFQKEILIIKSEIYPIVRKHYPKNTHNKIRVAVLQKS